VPLSGEVEEADRRMRVRRRLFDETGREVAPGALAQGRLYVVEWQIEADDAPAENVVVEDLLPAGLEIENENLRTSEFLPWARERTTLPVRFVDRRDDRLVAFASTFSGRQTYAYAVRAVAPGRFAGPAVTASCMYAPELRSVHGRTMVVVEAAK
jgi:uncharacterized protein YfaS (alpha-2-macroglobulin family)